MAVLQQVQDAAWAVQQCRSVVTTTFDQQDAVLQCGLDLTTRHCSLPLAEASEPGKLVVAIMNYQQTALVHTAVSPCDRGLRTEYGLEIACCPLTSSVGNLDDL